MLSSSGREAAMFAVAGLFPLKPVMLLMPEVGFIKVPRDNKRCIWVRGFLLTYIPVLIYADSASSRIGAGSGADSASSRIGAGSGVDSASSRIGAGSGADSVSSRIGAGSGADSVSSRIGAGSGADSVSSRIGAGSGADSVSSRIGVTVIIGKFDDDIGAVCSCTVICVQGVQEWAEDAALRCTSVEGQGS